jgi:putative oxidoreductase
MELGLFVIHVAIGVSLVAHGAQHVLGWFGGYGLKGTGDWMEGFGLRPGKRFAAAAGGAELAGGALFALGLLTPVAAALIASVMFVASRTDHRGKGYWIYNGGSEYVLAIAAVVIGVALNGAGAWSLDAALGLDVNGLAFGLGALGAALAGAGGTLALRDRRALAVEEPQAAGATG